MGLEAALGGLQNAVATMAGLARVHSDPPESISEFPAAIVYAWEGEMEASAVGDRAIHTAVVEIHESRQVLPQAIDRAKQWPDKLLAALRANPTLGGSVAAIVWPVRYRARPLLYGSELHYGIRFEVRLKIID